MDELRDRQVIYWLDSILFDKRAKHLMLAVAGRGRDIMKLPDDWVCEVLSKEDFLNWKNGKHINIEENWSALTKKQISMTYFGAKDYPKKLLHIPDPPFCIYYRGMLPDEHQHSVAMIGARKNSEYGAALARQFARYFAQHGIAVVSGMAMGIDGISQKEALAYGGASYGVLGCGVDVVYPPSNRALYQSLVQEGGLLSEYLPGAAAMAWMFPPRNRIISGLADCVLVVEARQKSGTLITVDMALEQGKDVFVIPGRCTDLLSYGCNKLIRNGATCVCSPQDLIEDMKWEDVAVNQRMKKAKLVVSPVAREIFKSMDFAPKSQDDILQSLRMRGVELTESQLCQGLLELELKGVILRNFGQYSVTVNGF